MATTTNFGWETPDDTDLVKDGALAIRTLGNAIDTSLVDLKGGTTGQVLSKTSNTDMDFTWVTSDDANAIQNAIVDAKGDLITATAADTPARLAVGTNGQVLTADSTTATGLKWATATSSGGMTLLSTTTLSGNSTNITGISTSYKNLVVFVKDFYPNVDTSARVRINDDATATNYQQYVLRGTGSSSNPYSDNNTAGIDLTGYSQDASSHDAFCYIFIPDYANTTTRKIISVQTSFNENNNAKAVMFNTTNYTSTSAITQLVFVPTGQSWSGGTVEIYGVN